MQKMIFLLFISALCGELPVDRRNSVAAQAGLKLGADKTLLFTHKADHIHCTRPSLGSNRRESFF
jgi:hypothetical protein